jgi:hypothetical protein
MGDNGKFVSFASKKWLNLYLATDYLSRRATLAS